MSLNLNFMFQTFIKALSGIHVTLELTFVTLLISAPIAFLWHLLSRRKKV